MFYHNLQRGTKQLPQTLILKPLYPLQPDILKSNPKCGISQQLPSLRSKFQVLTDILADQTV